jgi:hypothetical protein
VHLKCRHQTFHLSANSISRRYRSIGRNNAITLNIYDDT